MDFNLLSGVFTVLSLAAFLGISYWAFCAANKAKFDALAHLPLESDDTLPPDQPNRTQTGA